MKRDWDLLRKQLTDIEEGRDVFADVPKRLNRPNDMSWAEFDIKVAEQQNAEARIFGHLELLIQKRYIDGLSVVRGADNRFSYAVHGPRLTMDGHDLLDTMRSATIWESIKTTAKKKGVELTFEAIKVLAGAALKHALG
ncbi:DUF2513 domain-containing protein [Pseudoduganella eburnea]|uniref:DUF2513 domain-containing protein n=1 Tax=Massilia eburnea TaxID=1776165 RepID=A0A6L6QMV6_9BURK|nr:DUF2513 domain-containing protein [Massilia eburnea]